MSDSFNWTTPQLEQRRAETSQGAVEYVDIGQDAPILCFHGNGVGNDAVVALEKPLLDEGFRLIVPNRPGYYNTPLQSGRTPDACADLAAELLDHLGIERVVAIGTSGGGPALCRFAARHPQRTAAVVLQCALAHPFDAGQWMPKGTGFLLPMFRHLRLFLPILRFAYRRQNRKLSGDFVASCMSKERFAEMRQSAALESLGRFMAEAIHRCSARLDGIENDWATWATESWLTPNCVTCPTLILHDQADTVVPIAHAHWAARCIPGAEFCELHACGHLIWVGKDREKLYSQRAAFIRRQFEKNRPAKIGAV